MSAMASQTPQIKEYIIAPRHWPLCHWPLTGEFPAQKASNVENVSVWWRHHGWYFCKSITLPLQLKHLYNKCTAHALRSLRQRCYRPRWPPEQCKAISVSGWYLPFPNSTCRHWSHDLVARAANLCSKRHEGYYVHQVIGCITRLILGCRPANERRRYFVTTSLIGWVQT